MKGVLHTRNHECIIVYTAILRVSLFDSSVCILQLCQPSKHIFFPVSMFVLLCALWLQSAVCLFKQRQLPMQMFQ